MAMSLMALVASVASGVLGYRFASRELIDQIERSMVAEIALHAEAMATEREDGLARVASLTNSFTRRLGFLVSDIMTYVGILYTEVTEGDDFLEVRLAGPDGRSQGINRAGNFLDYDQSGNPVFQAALAGQMVVGRFEPYTLPDGQETTALEIAGPVRDSSGEVVGVLSALLPAQRFQERVEKFSLATEGRSLLVHRDGTILLAAGEGVVAAPCGTTQPPRRPAASTRSSSRRRTPPAPPWSWAATGTWWPWPPLPAPTGSSWSRCLSGWWWSPSASCSGVWW